MLSTSFKEELSVHERNAVLIRENSPRGNSAFKSSIVRDFYEIDFECIVSNMKECNEDGGGALEKVLPTVLRTIQAVAEDQTSFYERFLDKLDKLVSKEHLAPTCKLVNIQHSFAKKYNNPLSSLYSRLISAFSDNEATTEVTIAYHEIIKSSLILSINKLCYLSRIYNRSLEDLSSVDISNKRPRTLSITKMIKKTTSLPASLF